MLNKIKENIF
ncbi:hypothetical protein TF3313_0378 [Tannerella forsythia 3313]|nr:hypothetical protein TF3313_0378 [Tannerella forsythia 3313]